MNKTKTIIILCLFSIFLFSVENAVAENSYSKDQLVCSPAKLYCGFFIECQGNTCQLYATHIIENSFPKKLKPSFMEIITVEKSTLYSSKKTAIDVKIETKKLLKNNANVINEYQQVCYTLGAQSDKRCGRVIKCNQSHCIIRETHEASYFTNSDGKQSFTTVEINSGVEREVDRNDITTNGPVVKDLILWDKIKNIFIKLLS